MRILSIIILFLSATASIFLTSCRQEIDFDQTDTIEDLPIELINTHLYGQVIDINNEAISNVSIKVQDSETETDENGYFNFDSIYADKNGTKIIASKKGFFQNAITIYPKLNHSLFSSIVMIEKNNSATMLSYEGGSIPVSSSATLNFEPNTLVYEDDGSNFEGVAHVEFEYMESLTLKNMNFFPGEKLGLSLNNESKGMFPYSLLLLDISDGKTKKLRLAKGQNAEFVFNMEGNQFPDETELTTWYFSNAKYHWQSNGIADNFDGQYVTRVNDVEYLAIADPFDAVKLSGKLQYTSEIEAARHKVIFMDKSQKAEMEIYSNDSGFYGGFVPKNTELSIEIRNECGKLVHEMDLGPINEEEEFSLELMESNDCTNLFVSGQLIDCNDNGAANAYVKISTDEQTVFFNSNSSGFFEGYLKTCDAERMTVSSGDLKNKLVSAIHRDLIITEEIRIADWRLCEVAKGKISVQFNDDYFFLTDELGFEISGGSMLFAGSSSDHSFDCYISYFKGEGEYHIGQVSEFNPVFLANNSEGISLKPKDINTYKLVIDEYVENEKIVGHIQGLARDENNNDIEGMMYIKFDIPIVN